MAPTAVFILRVVALWDRSRNVLLSLVTIAIVSFSDMKPYSVLINAFQKATDAVVLASIIRVTVSLHCAWSFVARNASDLTILQSNPFRCTCRL